MCTYLFIDIDAGSMGVLYWFKPIEKKHKTNLLKI